VLLLLLLLLLLLHVNNALHMHAAWLARALGAPRIYMQRVCGYVAQG
jgi:hypothetical protein